MKFTETQIRELAGIFDDIITSDSDAVKSAFQRLAFLGSLARTEDSETGPFSDMVARLDWMEREMVELRREVQILQNTISPQDLLSDTISIDLSAPSIAAGQTYTMASPSYTSGSVTIAPLTASDIITLTQSTLDGFNHGST